jgi:RNA polymerase sigma-70 factor (ECF subfamily)
MTIDRIDIKGIIRGDREIFRKVYLAYYDMLNHLCIEYTHNAHIAEEIVQDTFMKLWEIRKEINMDTNIGNFLYTIAKNKCLNYLRDQQTILKVQKNREFLESQFDIEALQEVGDQWIRFEELKVLFKSVIEAMPEGIRKAFILSRYEGMKYKEIAQYLNISVKTVEVRISRALALLRKALDNYNSEAL